MNWTLVLNSLLVGALTTTLAVAAGWTAALGLIGLERRWRKIIVLLAVLALALPPFLVVNCWIDLLGATGRWRGWLPFNIYSLGGAAWVLALLTWPITLLLVLAAWQRLEPAQLESDPALCGWPLIRWLFWPAARAATGQAAVLTFVLALNHFAVPAILQVKVLPAEIWVRFSTDLQPGEALLVGWPLVVAPLVLLLILRRTVHGWPHVFGPARPRTFRRQLGAGWQGLGLAVALFLVGLSVGLPVGRLVVSSQTWVELPNLLRVAPSALGHSLGYAAGASTGCVAFGLLTWRWSWGWLFWLTLLAPGVLLGIGLITIFNRPGLELLYRSSGIVVLALVARYLALGWTGAARAMRATDRDLSDAARLEGARGWTLWRHVYGPQIAPTMAAAWYLTYLLCLWDVETLVLIYPPGGETLALRVFNLLHYGHNAQVNALCLVLLGLAVAPLALAGAARFLAARWKVP